MHRKLYLLAALCAVLVLSPACDSATVNRLAQAAQSTLLSEDDIGLGLKQALEDGITRGAAQLSQRGGYFDSPYKILLPEEARRVTDRLQRVPGFNNIEDIVLEKINAGAEDAASKARPIFVDAIRQMSFADATSILMGADDAATSYLRDRTFEALYAEFSPVIAESLDKFQARKVWSDAQTAYNKIPLIEDVDVELADYVTREALSGLFQRVAVEELNIRDNVSARSNDLVRRVFARQDERS